MSAPVSWWCWRTGGEVPQEGSPRPQFDAVRAPIGGGQRCRESVRRYPMATKLLFASRRAGLLGWHQRPRQTPSRVLPLFAGLAAIFLSASTSHLDASATAPTQPAPF